MTEIVKNLTLPAVRALLETVNFGRETVAESEWEMAMTCLREDAAISPDALQQTWWLFPVYRECPDELKTLLTAVEERREEKEEGTTAKSESTDSEPGDETLNGGSQPMKAAPPSIRIRTRKQRLETVPFRRRPTEKQSKLDGTRRPMPRRQIR